MLLWKLKNWVVMHSLFVLSVFVASGLLVGFLLKLHYKSHYAKPSEIEFFSENGNSSASDCDNNNPISFKR